MNNDLKLCPKHNMFCCPICDCEKEIKFDSFNNETGQIDIKTMSASSYKNLIVDNKSQPTLKDICKPVECYCPQCYVSFSINKSLGIF